MKLAFVTIFDANDPDGWSGLDFHMRQALESTGVQIEVIDNLRHGRSIPRRLRKLWARQIENRSSLHFWDVDTAKGYANHVEKRLRGLAVDAVISASPIPIAYLRTTLPKILWTDANFSALSSAYDEFCAGRLSKSALRHGKDLERQAESTCRLIIYASEWAKQVSLRNGANSSSRIEVVPLAANMAVEHSVKDVERLDASRDQHVIKLLFVGVDWFRKGGAKAVAIAQDIREKGYNVELTVVGCTPPEQGQLPDFVKVLGFISKATIEGRMLLSKLFSESHFLLVPTTAEMFGMVFAEASAFGVPSFSHRVGGVPAIVIDGANGFLFGVEQPISDWSESIIALFADKARMRSLAISCFEEYIRRLNWNVASQEAIALIEQTITSS